MSIPTNYQEALAFLGSRDSRVVRGKKATKVVKEGTNSVALYYHRTPVVTWYPDGRIVLRSGGHHTVTTKRRMNQAVPDVAVWQRNFEWWVTPIHKGGCCQENPLPFQDGMVV
jgi:hypothetical protein